ncbi:hypothetical protein ANN_23448 [Periplaneta americana]|uniref:DUF4817 domain-containing protein n=1 Tax=Periplaneta americana TaxID=6978 RepID=A0ABQ8SL65_PERAM|nr:hypothetical protein ANN_23448 [Periplaneta americana]
MRMSLASDVLFSFRNLDLDLGEKKLPIFAYEENDLTLDSSPFFGLITAHLGYSVTTELFSPSFTAEYADIVYVYGLCNGSFLRAVGEYERRFPKRRVPYRRVFTVYGVGWKTWYTKGRWKRERR